MDRKNARSYNQVLRDTDQLSWQRFTGPVLGMARHRLSANVYINFIVVGLTILVSHLFGASLNVPLDGAWFAFDSLRQILSRQFLQGDRGAIYK